MGGTPSQASQIKKNWFYRKPADCFYRKIENCFYKKPENGHYRTFYMKSGERVAEGEIAQNFG